MDSHGKGRIKERESMLRWQDVGFTCWQPPRTKYGKQDILGVGDFIVVGENRAWMVQVCAKKSAARHKRAVDAWNKEHGDALWCMLEVY